MNSRRGPTSSPISREKLGLTNHDFVMVYSGRINKDKGVEELIGSPVYAPDLRAAAALVVAGIIAKGKTEIYNLEYLDRGYENLEEKFRNLGAKIERVTE